MKNGGHFLLILVRLSLFKKFFTEMFVEKIKTHIL